MSADDDPSGQADALMRRRRSFVARPAPPPAPAPAGDDGAIPLLTEVVVAAATPPAPPPLLLPDDAALSAEIDRWIAQALPEEIARASSTLSAALLDRARGELMPNLIDLLNNGTRQKL